MAKVLPLTEFEVGEIVRLFKEGESIPTIAPKFGRADASIRRIVIGKSYRRLTCRDHIPGDSCECLSCSYERCRDSNLATAYGSQCQVRCQYCQSMCWRKVLDVVHRHGYVFCDSCDGRRK